MRPTSATTGNTCRAGQCSGLVAHERLLSPASEMIARATGVATEPAHTR